MPGKADGISSRQYSPPSPPSPPSSFLYPTLSLIGFLSTFFVLLPNFELCKETLGVFRVPLESSVFIRVS